MITLYLIQNHKKIMNISQIEDSLISEIKLNSIQAKVYLLITCYGKMTPSQIAIKLNISDQLALQTSKELMELGAFIDISKTEFEAMLHIAQQ